MLDADSKLAAIVKGGTVANLGGVENNDIGGHSGAEQPTVLQAEAPRRVGGELLDRLLQRPDALVADVLTQVPGEAAPAARVGAAAGIDPVAAGHHGGVARQV